VHEENTVLATRASII